MRIYQGGRGFDPRSLSLVEKASKALALQPDKQHYKKEANIEEQALQGLPNSSQHHLILAQKRAALQGD